MTDQKRKTKPIVDEPSFVVSPSLAGVIGLNEALVLAQLHYWIDRSKHIIEGRSWVYNTYADWGKQFPFWSASTIRRTLASLESRGLIETTSRHNRRGFDNTKWYTINYAIVPVILSRPSVQNEQMSCPIQPDALVNLSNTIPYINDISSSDTAKTPKQAEGYPEQFEQFWAAYPRKLEKKAALKAWKNTVKETSPDLLIRAAAGYAEHCRRENTAQQYVKHAARFMNSGAYEDYLAEPETVPPSPKELDPYLLRMREIRRENEDDRDSTS